jgi:hypothetical protein
VAPGRLQGSVWTHKCVSRRSSASRRALRPCRPSRPRPPPNRLATTVTGTGRRFDGAARRVRVRLRIVHRGHQGIGVLKLDTDRRTQRATAVVPVLWPPTGRSRAGLPVVPPTTISGSLTINQDALRCAFTHSAIRYTSPSSRCVGARSSSLRTREKPGFARLGVRCPARIGKALTFLRASC